MRDQYSKLKYKEAKLDKKEKELTSKQESLDQREADMKIKEKAIRELYEQKLQKMHQLKMAN